ncbi:TRAP transporter small permease [Sedimentitalea nanhaiensis]|uniref:TRAP transporter small permease protein n=1 Tax=Sedimentitalea nanhaiensis TaxID=999627 RepID=A0A1I7E682_9RHOB|nr:TRAP transporter small permease [Sedimentitalea nanhaiensis]SFU19451.1 TRAP-type C4-dicarboxylate transport system, small permease component [Sedimentitalea nanhaiensis]
MTTGTLIATLVRIEAVVVRVIRLCLGVGLIAMVVINVLNAVGRYSGTISLVGADELLVYGMIWIVMLGAILAARDRDHLSIDLLPSGLSGTAATALQLVIDLVTLIVAGFVAWHSASFIERIAMIGQTSMGLGIPMTLPHAAIFVGFAGIAAVTAVLLASDLSKLTGKRETRT